MDMQNRVGHKHGSGGPASQQDLENARRERLRLLALETIDLSKDPYFMLNHLGQVECKLCLTIHPNDANYLSHTQGRKHQTNLTRRAQKSALETRALLPEAKVQPVASRRPGMGSTIKIGRPAFTVTPVKEPHENGNYGIYMEVEYPEITANTQVRWRMVSAYEQRTDPCDDRYQYIAVTAQPYETIALKIPNKEVDVKNAESGWNETTKVFRLQIKFKDKDLTINSLSNIMPITPPGRPAQGTNSSPVAPVMPPGPGPPIGNMQSGGAGMFNNALPCMPMNVPPAMMMDMQGSMPPNIGIPPNMPHMMSAPYNPMPMYGMYGQPPAPPAVGTVPAQIPPPTQVPPPGQNSMPNILPTPSPMNTDTVPTTTNAADTAPPVIIQPKF